MAIERRAGLSCAEFRREYLLPRRPVILPDALRSMPACSRWSPHYLAERRGCRSIYPDDGWVEAESFLQAIAEASAAAGRTPVLPGAATAVDAAGVDGGFAAIAGLCGVQLAGTSVCPLGRSVSP